MANAMILSASPEDTLVLSFDNKTSISAQDLGDLFASLAKDYRLFTKGRILVVARLETGSLIAYLRDAIAAVTPNLRSAEERTTASKALKSFSNRLADEISATKQDPSASDVFLKGRKSGTTRSIESIIKVAAESGCEVNIRHSNSAGELVEVNINPGEAASIRKLKTEQQGIDSAKGSMPLIEIDREPLSLTHFSSASFTKSLVKHSGLEEGQIPDDIRLVISSVVRMLQKHGLSFMIDDIVRDLELAGRASLASVVRQAASAK